MVDKQSVAFLEESFYEEVVAEEEVIDGDGGTEEVITDHYVTDDGTLITSSHHSIDGLISYSDDVTAPPNANNGAMQQQQQHSQMVVNAGTANANMPGLDHNNVMIQHSVPGVGLEEQNVVDPYPRPKHERCRCEAKLYIHHHCAICSKAFALGCMLRHFQHLHYPAGTVKTTYAHLIDEERELYGVISYAQLTPNPAHVIKLANGTKRCSNSMCKTKRREGSMEECEHCLAIDDGMPSAPEPIFIEQQVLENCHKDFVDSYKQYCNSAAQHGVPAVCVLRAPPHLTSHIIYSCFNENNIQKRYLVVQYEPTISCSCGVGAEKACWHRAIVSLCCQAPGQSDNDSLEPPFQTLFSVREMQRFIDTSAIDTSASKNDRESGRSSKSGSKRNKIPKMSSRQQQHQMTHHLENNNNVMMGRDSSEIEHAQLLSELGGAGGMDSVYDASGSVMNTLSSVGGVAQQALMASGTIPTHPQNLITPGTTLDGFITTTSNPELLLAINRLNDTIESLRSEIVTLKSQVAESNKYATYKYRDENESMYTITVNGVHNTRSTLEDISRKQVKIVVPPISSAALNNSNANMFKATSSSTSQSNDQSTNDHITNQLSSNQEVPSDGFTVDQSQLSMPVDKYADDELTKSAANYEEFGEMSESENDPNRVKDDQLSGSVATDLSESSGRRSRRQVQPNRLYNGKEFLVDSSITSSAAPFKAKSN